MSLFLVISFQTPLKNPTRRAGGTKASGFVPPTLRVGFLRGVIIPAAGAEGPGLSPEAAEVIQPRLAASGVTHQLGEAGAPKDAGREVIGGRGVEARQLRLGERGQNGQPDNS